MQRVLASTAALVALVVTVSSAVAADLSRRPPPPPPAPPAYAPVPFYNWTGFYIGINGGGAWGGRSRFDFPGSPPAALDVSGWLAGGTLGANYQLGHFVFGLEGDIDGADIRGSTACLGGFTCRIRNDWLATARGRIGYAFDRLLPYVTGGAAFGGLNASIPGIGSASDTNAGWTVGGGIEFALTGNWTAKAEYLYVDLGNFDCAVCNAGPPPARAGFTTNVVRAGVNFRF
jgi:outer membrane immunogenic protein